MRTNDEDDEEGGGERRVGAGCGRRKEDKIDVERVEERLCALMRCLIGPGEYIEGNTDDDEEGGRGTLSGDDREGEDGMGGKMSREYWTGAGETRTDLGGAKGGADWRHTTADGQQHHTIPINLFNFHTPTSSDSLSDTHGPSPYLLCSCSFSFLFNWQLPTPALIPTLLIPRPLRHGTMSA